MLGPVVLLFSLAVSWSPSQAPAYCSCRTPSSPGCSHRLGAPSFGLLGRVPAGAGASGTIHPSHHWGRRPGTWPASPPSSRFGIIPPHSSSSELHPLQWLSRSALHLPRGAEEATKSWEAATRQRAPAAFPRWQEVTLFLAAGECDIAGNDGAGVVPGGGGYLVYSL